MMKKQDVIMMNILRWMYRGHKQNQEASCYLFISFPPRLYGGKNV